MLLVVPGRDHAPGPQNDPCRYHQCSTGHCFPSIERVETGRRPPSGTKNPWAGGFVIDRLFVTADSAWGRGEPI